ncbi:MAG: bifunctional precorrin-2 dehydrogenase/sirohydrochlorin ferrochelatase [Endomicrobiales bacterium]|jgi:siroheme synthase-like protein
MKTKKYYPVCMDIDGRTCVVVGGGAIAYRKVRSLLSCGGHVIVISPQFNTGLISLGQKRNIVCRKAVYHRHYLKGADLVIAATDNGEVNRAVSADALRKGIPVNVVDSPDLSTFIVPAVLQIGTIGISVSTGGESPFLAKSVKERIKSVLGKEYAEYSRICAAARKKIRQKYSRADVRSALYQKIQSSPITGLLKAGRFTQARDLAEHIIREGNHVV